MRVIRVNLYRYDQPFGLEFQSSQAHRTSAYSVVVRLDFENGISGYGESAPRSYVTGETRSSVLKVIQDVFSPILIARKIHTIEDVQKVLDDLEGECVKRDLSHYNSALGAIDIAMLDALGKSHQLPVASLLGTIIREHIPYSISIPLLPPKIVQELIPQLQVHEFQYIKVLLGEVERENLERVKLIRSLFGENARILVESNGKWHFQQAVSNLLKLRELNIIAVEQPLPKDDYEGLKRLKKVIGIPVIADESMCSLSDAKKLIEGEACDILNIKVSKCGGLLRAKQIADFAEKHNILCQLGAHVGETDILSAAGKSLAFTMSNLIFLEGYSFLLYREEWKRDHLESRSQKKDPLSHFGLGLRVANQKLIEKYSLPISDMVSNTGTRSI